MLTDLGMEPVDGLQVCHEIITTQRMWLPYMQQQKNILKFKSKRECPVVAVTAFRDQSTTQYAKEAGMKEVLHKPVNPDRLKQVIDLYYHDKMPG